MLENRGVSGTVTTSETTTTASAIASSSNAAGATRVYTYQIVVAYAGAALPIVLL